MKKMIKKHKRKKEIIQQTLQEILNLLDNNPLFLENNLEENV